MLELKRYMVTLLQVCGKCGCESVVMSADQYKYPYEEIADGFVSRDTYLSNGVLVYEYQQARTWSKTKINQANKKDNNQN